MTDPVVIIGTGLAGYSTAKEFRKLDEQTPLHIISADSGYSYSKPLLSNALGKSQSAEALPMADAAKMAATLNATVQANLKVESIRPQEHAIVVDSKTLKYRSLVLALGADQRQLPFTGDAVEAIHSINDLDEYAEFRKTLAGAKRVAIIGAGLIGSEFANDLNTGGFEVDVIEPFAHPLGRLVPFAVGDRVRRALSDLGVNWHLERTCDDVSKCDGGYRLTLSDASEIVCDVVLSAVGLVPRTKLAADAGLTLGTGIKVNRQLQTSAPDVYALGDCMEIEGLVLPYIMPIMHAARALGKTLAGDSTDVSYPVMPVVVKTPAHPVVISPPAPNSEGQWQIEEDEDGVKATFESSAGEPLGFVLTGTKTKERMAMSKTVPPVLA